MIFSKLMLIAVGAGVVNALPILTVPDAEEDRLVDLDSPMPNEATERDGTADLTPLPDNSWVARASVLTSAPINLLRGTVVVPDTYEEIRDDLTHVPILSFDDFDTLRAATELRPPHGWILTSDVELSGAALRRGAVLLQSSSSDWEDLLHNVHTLTSLNTTLRFSSASYVFWNGAQSRDPCLTLLQPVMHYDGGQWSMDTWFIPYYPKAKSDPGPGATRTSEIPLLPGERVTMGIYLASEDASTLYYNQWWSLTSNSTPFTYVDGIWRSNQVMIQNQCDRQSQARAGEGGLCSNCYMSVLDKRWSTATVGAKHLHSSLQQCQQSCCEDTRCRAINFNEEQQECYMLQAFSDSSVQADDAGWVVHVRGQLQINNVLKQWTDLNGHECSSPATWGLGLVLEVFHDVDSPSVLPEHLAFDDVVVSLTQNPDDDHHTYNWNTWTSDAAAAWGMNVKVNGRTMTLTTPHATSRCVTEGRASGCYKHMPPDECVLDQRPNQFEPTCNPDCSIGHDTKESCPYTNPADVPLSPSGLPTNLPLCYWDGECKNCKFYVNGKCSETPG